MFFSLQMAAAEVIGVVGAVMALIPADPDEGNNHGARGMIRTCPASSTPLTLANGSLCYHLHQRCVGEMKTGNVTTLNMSKTHSEHTMHSSSSKGGRIRALQFGGGKFNANQTHSSHSINSTESATLTHGSPLRLSLDIWQCTDCQHIFRPNPQSLLL